MHRAEHEVDLVAAYEAIDVVGCLGGLRFVVDLYEFDLASGELAASLLEGKAKPVFDRHARRRERTGIRQHQSDLHLCPLGTHSAQAGECGSPGSGGSHFQESPAAGQAPFH